jgi:pyruvate dehydrogenase E2 component (dihydrolipoamide acetyltransferase)
MQLLSMPRLGQTMDVGILVTRHVDVDTTFVVGDPLYTVETEKVETEIEAKHDGRLLRWLADQGDEIPVGAPVAVLGAVDERLDDEAIDRFVDRMTGGGVTRPPATDAGVRPGPSGSALVEPTSPGSGMSPAGRHRAVPKARALAKEHDVDLAQIEHTGDGPITVAQVEAHLARSAPVASDPGSTAATATPVRLDGHRRAMAVSMTTSWSTIPHFTEMIDVDATALLAERDQHDRSVRRPTVTAYLIREFARTCRAVPVLHAGFVDGGSVERSQVDMAIAVDTPHGLVAPVMRAVDRLAVTEIAERLTDLAERARTRRLTVDDVEGGHVALSNLGAFGVRAGIPVIPPKQTAMLFAGAISERAVVVDGGIVARPMMSLSLTCDHRLVDGATAARALQALRASIERHAPD